MLRTLTLGDGAREYRVTVQDDGRVQVDSQDPVAAVPVADGMWRVGDETPRPAWAIATADARWVYFDGRAYRFEAARGGGRPRARAHHGSLASPMPATVLKIQVAPGDAVKRGATLIILEAMKMELPVRASADGIVTAVHCREGDLVSPGVGLIEIDETAD